ncbi:MAG: acetate--CoA ligase family protein [Dongiaceae bacterium]
MNDQGRAAWLAPLLKPASVAVVGASPKLGSAGYGMIRSAIACGFEGGLYAVNPNYREIEGVPCFPSIAALPERIDHAILGVANARLEAVFREAIEHKVGAATIFASCYLPDDTEPKLLDRLRTLSREANMPVCGGNGMGYLNLQAKVDATAWPPPDWIKGGGHMALITHSGSVFSALSKNDRRLRYNLVVSPGQEISGTMADYMDFALEEPSTRVIGLFLETVRDPARFLAALAKAEQRDIPIVALKVGRTEMSARMAASHSGAVVGNQAAYEAVFERYGVVAVNDLDQMTNTMLLLSQDRRVRKGGLATIHDSGGERELLIDQADAYDVRLAEINETTRDRLAERLEYGLEPINPVDAWGTGHDYEGIFTHCLTAIAQDPDTAIAAICAETRTGNQLHEDYGKIARHARDHSDVPIIVLNNVAAIGDDDLTVRLCADGIAVLTAMAPGLFAIRSAFWRRDRALLPKVAPRAAPKGLRAKWQARLSEPRALDEAEGLALFADYGVPVLPHHVVKRAADAIAAADKIGYPVALKTATPGILHKSDVGGVRLALANADAVRAAYDDIAGRLGPRALVMKMAGKGVEMAFGMIEDPHFGPVVMVGAGGILIELLKDRRVALPSFDPATAGRMIDRLAIRPVLGGVRGAPPSDIAALAEALSAFSAMVADLAGLVSEIDVNPVIVGYDFCVALDALVIPKAAQPEARNHGH